MRSICLYIIILFSNSYYLTAMENDENEIPQFVLMANCLLTQSEARKAMISFIGDSDYSIESIVYKKNESSKFRDHWECIIKKKLSPSQNNQAQLSATVWLVKISTGTTYTYIAIFDWDQPPLDPKSHNLETRKSIGSKRTPVEYIHKGYIIGQPATDEIRYYTITNNIKSNISQHKLSRGKAYYTLLSPQFYIALHKPSSKTLLFITSTDVTSLDDKWISRGFKHIYSLMDSSELNGFPLLTSKTMIQITENEIIDKFPRTHYMLYFSSSDSKYNHHFLYIWDRTITSNGLLVKRFSLHYDSENNSLQYPFNILNLENEELTDHYKRSLTTYESESNIRIKVRGDLTDDAAQPDRGSQDDQSTNPTGLTDGIAPPEDESQPEPTPPDSPDTPDEKPEEGSPYAAESE